MPFMSPGRRAYAITVTAQVGHECTLKSQYFAETHDGFEVDEALKFATHELERWESKYGNPDSVTLTIRPTRSFI